MTSKNGAGELGEVDRSLDARCVNDALAVGIDDFDVGHVDVPSLADGDGPNVVNGDRATEEVSEDMVAGKPGLLRFVWQRLSNGHASWEQSQSADGKDWMPNWTMEFVRA